MDDAAASNRAEAGERLSALGLHARAAYHYWRLAEFAERRGRSEDAARYRELAEFELRLDADEKTSGY